MFRRQTSRRHARETTIDQGDIALSTHFRKPFRNHYWSWTHAHAQARILNDALGGRLPLTEIARGSEDEIGQVLKELKWKQRGNKLKLEWLGPPGLLQLKCLLSHCFPGGRVDQPVHESFNCGCKQLQTARPSQTCLLWSVSSAQV